MADARFGRPRSYERELPSRGFCGLGRKMLGELGDDFVEGDPTPRGFSLETGMGISRELDRDRHSAHCRSRVDSLTDDLSTLGPQ